MNLYWMIVNLCIGTVGSGLAAIYDWKSYRIPNRLIVVLGTVGILSLLGQLMGKDGVMPVLQTASVVFAVILVLSTLLFQRVIESIYRWRGKQERVLLGPGDLKLMLVLSLFLPYHIYVIAAGIGCILLAVVGPIRYLLLKKTRHAVAPYIFISCLLITFIVIYGIMGGFRWL